MSLVNDVRTITDTAVEQGRQALTEAQRRVLGRADTARQQADAAATDARGRVVSGVDAITDATRRQALAVLGAGDVAIGAVSRRVERAPAVAADLARDLRARGEALRTRGERAVNDLGSFDPGQALDSGKQGANAYVGLARSVYDGLTERGERVVADLRRDPRLLRVLGSSDRAVQTAADRVADSAGRVRRQARAVSEQAAADERSVTATKAAATRKAQADKRAATARKAVATRKANEGTTRRSTSPGAKTATKPAAKATRKTARKSTTAR